MTPEELLKKIFSLEPGFDDALDAPSKFVLANKIMLAVTEQKLLIDGLAKTCTYLPNLEDLENEVLDDELFEKLTASLTIVINGYKKVNKENEDILFLLGWYMSKVREIRNGKAS